MDVLQVWMENSILWAMAGVCLCDMMIKILLHSTYKRLLREATDIAHSKHRLMKTLRMKFDTCYQLKIGVPNVGLFVEKYLQHYRIGGISIKAWENITNICIVFIMSGSVGKGLWAMMNQQTGEAIFLPLLGGVIGTGFLLFLDVVWNTENRFEMLRVDITDYLENICKPRLENETFHPTELREYQEEYFEKDNVVDLKSKQKEIKIPPIEFSAEEEEVIREVIQEYLG